MLIMGWDGTEVTPQIRTLIEQHYLGSILLTAKNLKCMYSSIPYSISIQYYLA
jgi:beta-N-acetylhexosaminidase